MAGPESKCSVELAERIASHVRLGSYWEPACVASGISYPTVRRWIQTAANDEAEGRLDSVYIRFRTILENASAEAENALVKMVAATPDDWRAQAFVLERRYRDRWGKQEQTVNTVNVVVSDNLVTQLADALRVAQATSSAIDAEFSAILPDSREAIASLTREASDSIETNTPQDLGVTKA